MTLRARGLARTIVGIGRDRDRLEESRGNGIVDEATTDLAKGVAGAEVVVVCTPPARIAEDCILAARHGPETLLVTDAGSTKSRIVAAVEADQQARSKFVAAHPIAGSERKGASAATANLFEGNACVLTPTDRTPENRLERARSFWKSLGCRLLETDPESHDQTLAFTSHLPHAVAAALAGMRPGSNAADVRRGLSRRHASRRLRPAPLDRDLRPKIAVLVLFALEISSPASKNFAMPLRSTIPRRNCRWWSEASRPSATCSTTSPGIDLRRVGRQAQLPRKIRKGGPADPTLEEP